MIVAENLKQFIIFTRNNKGKLIETDELSKTDLFNYICAYNRFRCCVCGQRTDISYNINLNQRKICMSCSKLIIKQFILEQIN